jgi:rhomboid protease GluP
MAFGFSPKHIQELQLDNLDKEHFLVLALEAANKLNWNVSFVSENGFIAFTKFSWSSWSEEVTVKINNGHVNLKSECTGNQLIDWGKNKKNIEALLAKFEAVKSVMTPDEIELKLVTLRQDFAANEEDILSKPPTSRHKYKITQNNQPSPKNRFERNHSNEYNIALLIFWQKNVYIG